MKAAIEGDEYKLGKLLTPVVMKGLEDLSKVVSGVTKVYEAMPRPLKDLTGGFVVFAALLSPAAFALSGVTRLLSFGVRGLELLTGLTSSIAETYLPGLKLALGQTATGIEEASIGTEAAAVGTGLSRLGSYLLPGAALFVGLETLNKLLPGHKSNIASTAFHYGEDLGKSVRNPFQTALHDALSPILSPFGLEYQTAAERGGMKSMQTASERAYWAMQIKAQNLGQGNVYPNFRAMIESLPKSEHITKVDLDGHELARVVDRINANGEARR